MTVQVDKLFSLALRRSPEKREHVIDALRALGSQEIYERALQLCHSRSARRRVIGVQILCQLGGNRRNFGKCAQDLFLQMLDTENDPDVLCALGWGLGHLDLEFPTRCLTRLSGHSDSRVRYGVVGGILRNECPEAIAAKILLSKDDDVDVRNWATFGLGTMEMDNDEIRHALAKRLDDSDCEVRFEAISGLAKRGDTRVLKCVQELIAQGDFEADAIALAKFLRDPRLLPTLQHCTPADEFESKLLEDAIKACESAN